MERDYDAWERRRTLKTEAAMRVFGRAGSRGCSRVKSELVQVQVLPLARISATREQQLFFRSTSGLDAALEYGDSMAHCYKHVARQLKRRWSEEAPKEAERASGDRPGALGGN